MTHRPPEEPRSGHLSNAQSEEERLHAERDLSRAELGETLDALASKADVATNSRRLVHTSFVRTQEISASAAGYVRRGYEHWNRTKQPSPVVLAAGAVALIAALAIAKYRSRVCGR